MTRLLAPRVAAVMVVLASICWFVTTPPVYLGEDYPNTVSARCDNMWFAIGCLSHRGASSCFWTRKEVEIGRSVWSEREDGHFCGFYMPTAQHGGFGGPDGSLNAWVGTSTIAVDLPYWLIVGFWFVVGCVYPLRFKIGDGLFLTLLVGCQLVLIRNQVSMPIVVLVNLTTSLCLLVCVACLVRRVALILSGIVTIVETTPESAG